MSFEVSIITPTIPERAELLRDAVLSVARQKIKPINHFISVDLKRKGPSYTRNVLAKSVDTEWISFLDDDDTLMANHILEASKHAEESDVIYTWCNVINRPGFNPNSHFDLDRLLGHENFIPITAFVRTSAFWKVSGFDLNSRYEDWDLWKRLALYGYRFTCVPKITWNYRFYGDNRTFEEE